MQAVIYTEYGTPDVLKLQSIDKPQPQPNEILIRVRATSVNFGDLMVRNMKSVTPSKFTMPTPLWLPTRMLMGWSKPNKQILGSELSGDVVAVGNEVTRFKQGDTIFAYLGTNFGGYAEYVCLAENSLVTHKPNNMSYEEATALPYGAMTALNLLQKANIQQGSKVLINGASGAIGAHAVQIAKSYGAHVTGVCGTPRVDYVKALGADEVIDYTQEDFTQNGKQYHLIFDVLGKLSFGRSRKSLTENGIYLLASFKIPHLIQMMTTSISGNQKVICALSSESLDDLNQVKELAEAGKIKAIIDKSFPLEQAAEAHRYVENGQKTASVVISVP